MKYAGGCHCGKITFEVEGKLDRLIQCNCSICSKQGYLLWFVPRDQVNLNTPESELGTYQFNKKVVRHHFCPVCGCAPIGFGADGKGNEKAAINARCLEDVDLSGFKVIHYNGRSKK